MGGTKQSLDAPQERSVSEVPVAEILAGMTKLHFCLLAYELKGFALYCFYTDNLRFVEQWMAFTEPSHARGTLQKSLKPLLSPKSPLRIRVMTAPWNQVGSH